MNQRSYNDEGIILACRDYSEADKIIVIFSKNHGRISLLAKGVRKMGSRKRGHIDVFNYLKFQVIVGKGLDLISEAEIINNYSEIRVDLKKVSLAYYFMEVVGKITHEEESNREVLTLLLAYLDNLVTNDELKKLRMSFIRSLLVTLGYWPHNQVLPNPEGKLEEVIERKIYSQRVGKQILT